VRNPISGTQFRRDVKLARKRGKDMAKLREAILLLIEGTPLPARFKDHPLSGEWKHYRDCHIEPDWLLLYKSMATACTRSALERTLICFDSGYPNPARTGTNRVGQPCAIPTNNPVVPKCKLPLAGDGGSAEAQTRVREMWIGDSPHGRGARERDGERDPQVR
jgi:mRNA interferase YafQ